MSEINPFLGKNQVRLRLKGCIISMSLSVSSLLSLSLSLLLLQASPASVVLARAASSLSASTCVFCNGADGLCTRSLISQRSKQITHSATVRCTRKPSLSHGHRCYVRPTVLSVRSFAAGADIATIVACFEV